MSFKRNQIETAYCRLLEPGSSKLSSVRRSRIRRLLETDRRLQQQSGSTDPERANFAFFDTDKPGRGNENWFSEYEAFAVLIGLRLMGDRWPQAFVVRVLRRLRPKLQREHARILKQDR